MPEFAVKTITSFQLCQFAVATVFWMSTKWTSWAKRVRSRQTEKSISGTIGTFVLFIPASIRLYWSRSELIMRDAYLIQWSAHHLQIYRDIQKNKKYLMRFLCAECLSRPAGDNMKNVQMLMRTAKALKTLAVIKGKLKPGNVNVNSWVFLFIRSSVKLFCIRK